MKWYSHAIAGMLIASSSVSTSGPIALGFAFICSQVPDIDTTKSWVGRILFPIAKTIEERFSHRSVTHSFLGNAIFAVVTSPIALISTQLYWAGVMGYFGGWISDAFTKRGVAAFFPSNARLVIPANPRLRLSTGSPIEYFWLVVLTIALFISIFVNKSGGILNTINAGLGIPQGAVEQINKEGAKYLLVAQITGIATESASPVIGEFEVVRSLTESDLLIRKENEIIRVGRTTECAIRINHIKIKRNRPIRQEIKEYIINQERGKILEKIPKAERVYLSGEITAETRDLVQPNENYKTITIQSTTEQQVINLKSAIPEKVIELVKNEIISGKIKARLIYFE